ncbi:MAG TPA: DNA sulfur modification protein DndE [Blastocatellia bacterium]|nr:DNA sulfur modification protein DndE [Blastocatellia bacterium]
MPIDNIYLSQQAKDQLIKLKRSTKIQHWNVLCRWAFCLSLAEPGIPPSARIPSDSSVEMSWKVFGGQYSEIYLALLKERCRLDGLGTADEVLTAQFRLHLHRGIGYLAADRRIKSISDFSRRVSINAASK